MCEHTTELPIVAEEIAVNGSDTVIVINDLSKHETYMNKPFVAGEPHARFHAGVPIKSPKGFHIGAYCVLDDKPRNGVDNAELVFLKDMVILPVESVGLCANGCNRLGLSWLIWRWSESRQSTKEVNI